MKKVWLLTALLLLFPVGVVALLVSPAFGFPCVVGTALMLFSKII